MSCVPGSSSSFLARKGRTAGYFSTTTGIRLSAAAERDPGGAAAWAILTAVLSQVGRICAHTLYVTACLTETGYTLAVVSRQTGDEPFFGETDHLGKAP